MRLSSRLVGLPSTFGQTVGGEKSVNVDAVGILAAPLRLPAQSNSVWTLYSVTVPLVHQFLRLVDEHLCLM